MLRNNESQEQPLFHIVELLTRDPDAALVQIQKLISSNPDSINQKVNGSTLLHLATFMGNKDVVKYLQQNGADINAQDQRGFTALHIAVNKQHIDIIKILAKRKPQILQDNEGKTALHLASELGVQHEIIMRICRMAPLAVHAQDKNGDTPLHLAVNLLNYEVIETILQYCDTGYSISNNKNITAQQAIETCAESDTIMECILVSCRSRRNIFYSPTVCAIKRSYLVALKYFLQKEPLDAYCLYVAYAEGNLDVVKYLLNDQGLLLNKRIWPHDRTPLMAACSHGNLEVIKYLVEEKKAPMDDKEGGDGTLLSLAEPVVTVGNENTTKKISTVQYLLSTINVLDPFWSGSLIKISKNKQCVPLINAEYQQRIDRLLSQLGDNDDQNAQLITTIKELANHYLALLPSGARQYLPSIYIRLNDIEACLDLYHRTIDDSAATVAEKEAASLEIANMHLTGLIGSELATVDINSNTNTEEKEEILFARAQAALPYIFPYHSPAASDLENVLIRYLSGKDCPQSSREEFLPIPPHRLEMLMATFQPTNTTNRIILQKLWTIVAKNVAHIAKQSQLSSNVNQTVFGCASSSSSSLFAVNQSTRPAPSGQSPAPRPQ